MRASSIFLALAGVALGACSLFTSFDDFVEPVPDAATSQPDAGADGARPEGDAGADTSIPDAAVDGRRACDATLCDDFDTPPLGAKWTTQEIDLATLTLVDGGESAPFALRSFTEGGTFAGRTARLTKRFTGFGGATCSFALKPVERTGNPLVLAFEGTAPEVLAWSVWISVTPTETRLGGGAAFKDGGVSPYAAEFAPVLPTNAWSHLEIVVGLSKATLKIEGVQVAVFDYPVAVSTSLVDMKLGLQAFETTAQDVLFDDLRCAVTN